MAADKDSLHAQRQRLFQLLQDGDSPPAAARFQEALFDAIVSAERGLKTATDRSPLLDHIRRCRAYGDALAWLTIAPHAIRQLAKNPRGAPPGLFDQGDAARGALDVVKACADKGVPAIYTDLTNCLKISDVVVSADPDVPHLLELKTRKSAPVRFSKREQRQVGRMEATAQYLMTDRTEVDGRPGLAVTSTLGRQYLWSDLQPICDEALKVGSHVEPLSPHQVVIAYQVDSNLPDLESAFSRFAGSPVYIGFHSDPLTKDWPNIPPPFVWDLTPEVRFSLMERTLVLVNLIKPSAFVGVSHESGVISDAHVAVEGGGAGGLKVDYGGEEVVVRSNFVNSALYAWETVESAGRSAIEAVRLLLEHRHEFESPNQAPQRPGDAGR